MKKLNLEQVEDFKEFVRPTAGGYICGIIAVEDVSEKEYLKVTYDIVDGDFKLHYSNLKKEKDWNIPYFFKSYKETALSFFKGFITAVENSNKNFKWADDETKLVGKKVGLVLAEEEYINAKGEKKVRFYVDQIHSVSVIKAGDFKVPELKLLNTAAQTPVASGRAKNPFETEIDDSDEVPFTTDENIGAFDEGDDEDILFV